MDDDVVLLQALVVLLLHLLLWPLPAQQQPHEVHC